MGWRASAASVRAARALARSASSAGASTSAFSAGAVTGAVGEADWRGRWRSTRIGHDRCPFHPGRTAAGAAVGRDHSRWMVLPSSPTSFARSFAASPQPAEDAADEDIGPVTLNFSELVAPGDSPLGAYERLSKQGVLRWDEAQHRALKTLNELHAKLVGDMDGGAAAAKRKSEAPKKEGSWFTDLFTAREEDDEGGYASHGGVYLFGGPGCGKTFCMDLFYASLPGTDGKEKRREHFHSFMLHTHQTLHKLGKAGHTEDTVAIYAQRVAKKTRVLCLDEFQVTDVADAMIIRRLLDQLWERGVTIVTTSNREPDELYKNGLNRVQFLPCIEAIKARCVVHPMESVRDYRLTGRGIAGEDTTGGESGGFKGTWRVRREGESHEEGERWLERRLQRLANEEKFIGVEVAMGGRRIQVPRAGGGVALFRFDEVCASAMGAGDYTAVASTFHTVGLSRVPRMTIERVDLMRRFITFIDVMYEHKVKLLACAPTSPATLFESSGGKGQRDEEFAWDRAASRLAEMSTQEYVEAPWRPKSGAWLLEQARVTEVVPPDVLRGLWQRYDADHNGVLDEQELEELLADLNQMRRGHRNVPQEQLDSAWEMLTNRGQRGTRDREGMGGAKPSRRGDAFITFECFIKYGNEAFAACMTLA